MWAIALIAIVDVKDATSLMRSPNIACTRVAIVLWESRLEIDLSQSFSTESVFRLPFV